MLGPRGNSSLAKVSLPNLVFYFYFLKIILFYICIPQSSNPCIIIIIIWYVSLGSFFLNWIMQHHFFIHTLLDRMVQGMSMGVVLKGKTSLCYTAGLENTTITKPFWVALKRKQGEMWVHQASSCCNEHEICRSDMIQCLRFASKCFSKEKRE